MSGTVEMVTNMRAQIDAVIESHKTGSWQAQHHYIGDRVSYLTGTAKARPEDPNQLTRSTGTVERRVTTPAAPGASIVFVSYDIRDDRTGRVININSGRVRMLDDQTPAPQVDADEIASVEAARQALNLFPFNRPLTARESAMVEAYRRGEMIKAPAMAISPRFDVESYGMRGHAGRRSDRVTHFSRLINGNRFDFSRIVWGDTGETTLRVYEGRTTNVLHEWTV